MQIYLPKLQAKKLIISHIEDELSTEEFGSLLIQLLKMYKKFQYADLEGLLEPFLKNREVKS